MSELVVLPPHLIDRIRQILAVDLDLPGDLRTELQDGLKQISPRSQSVAEGDDGDDETPRPPTLDVNVLERLSRWVGSNDQESDIRRTGLGEPSFAQTIEPCVLMIRSCRIRYDRPTSRYKALHPSEPTSHTAIFIN